MQLCDMDVLGFFGKKTVSCKHSSAKLMVEFSSQPFLNPPMEMLAKSNKCVCVLNVTKLVVKKSLPRLKFIHLRLISLKNCEDL